MLRVLVVHKLDAIIALNGVLNVQHELLVLFFFLELGVDSIIWFITTATCT